MSVKHHAPMIHPGQQGQGHKVVDIDIVCKHFTQEICILSKNAVPCINRK